MKKILFIPHTGFTKNIRMRPFEFARSAADHLEVWYLMWEPLTEKNILSKIKTQLNNLFPKKIVIDKVNLLKVPKLQVRNAISMKINSLILNFILKKLEVDIIWSSATYHYEINNDSNDYIYIYDLVDDHIDCGSNIQKKFVSNEITKADYVVTINNILKEKIENNFNLNAIYLPNGIREKKYLEPSDLNKLKSKLEISDNKIVSYIGNHISDWGNLEFVSELSNFLNKKNEEIKVLVVGPILKKHKNMLEEDHAIVTGPVDSDKVDMYFELSDIGILPFKLNDFTNNSLPIKVLEYGNYNNHVISSPLKSLIEYDFSNVIIKNNFDVVKWAESIINYNYYNNEKNFSDINEYKWDKLFYESLKKVGINIET